MCDKNLGLKYCNTALALCYLIVWVLWKLIGIIYSFPSCYKYCKYVKNCFPGCSLDIEVRQFKGILNVNDLTDFQFIVLSHRDIGIFLSNGQTINLFPRIKKKKNMLLSYIAT